MSYRAFVGHNPLIRFSVHTHRQIHVLGSVAGEIRAHLNAAIADAGANTERLDAADGLFWMWVLGAYEVTRTVGQAKDCFSPSAHSRIVTFKRHIAGLRIPFAKQEYAGDSKSPLQSEQSIYGIDSAQKDFSFEVREAVFWGRDLLDQFEALVASITPAGRPARSSLAAHAVA
jgi:hypothetical protein